MNKLKGIDISEFNGDIDFKKVKNEVDFIYIRATYGRYGIDKKFKNNVEGCIKENIPFGLYLYSYATSTNKAEEESNNFFEAIKEYKDKMTYPPMIDMEDEDSYKLNNGNPDKETLSDICVIFCELMIKNQLTPIIYASADWFKHRLDEEKISKYLKWVAWWETKEENIDTEKYKIWQYSSKGKIEGIKTQVDLNYSFIDFKKLKTYIENINKFNFIKAKTLIQDLSIQYLSCYKFGQELIDKIYEGLKKDKIIRTCKDYNSKLKAIGKYFNLASTTLVYINSYLYAIELVEKLYIAITEK